jgi:hypothetical protein
MTRRAKVKQHTTEKQEAPKDLVKKEHTDEEKRMVAKYLDRAKKRAVKFERVSGETGEPRLYHVTDDAALSEAKMTEALGTPDEDLQKYLLTQAIQTFRGYVSAEGTNDERLAEFANDAMALLNGIQPQDEIEGMLAVQMIAVHNMAMETMKRAMITGQNEYGTDVNVNRATRMLRTFNAQMEALKRYRTGGQQKVIVEHVYVTAGGQAIVGVVNRGEGNSGKRE